MAAWDAVETAARVRRGEVSAREVVEAAIARAGDAAATGAVVTACYERARQRAGATPGGELAGVPTFLKDLSQLAGVATTWGSAAGGAFVSRRSDPFVKKVERTGVVVLGKSATPELGLLATTEPLGRPPTRNPWDLSRSAGGSSGGAAALVAAGVVPLAAASDGGGSIRIPAACCGLVGLKPTRGRIDMEGSALLPVNLAVHGCVSRTVRDQIAFHRALGWLGAIDDAPPRPLRIGVYVDAPIGTPVDPEVRAAVLAAGETCRALGHEVDVVPCPFDGEVIEDFLAYWGLIAWLQVRSGRLVMHRGFDARRVEPLTTWLAARFSAGGRAVLGAVRRLRRFRRTYDEVFARFDVLVSPTTATPAPPLGELAPGGDCATVFARQRAFVPFTPLNNAAGAPAISLPLGRSAGGLPIGVMLSAARGEDPLLLKLARAIEEARPWPRLAPRSNHDHTRMVG
jgi:amidase